MARDWNDYQAKIREEIERKVAHATERAERKAERMRARAERSAERARERAAWYGEKLKEKVEREAEHSKERAERTAEHVKERFQHGWDPSRHAFRFSGFGGCSQDGRRNHGTEILVGMAILAVGAGLLLSNLGVLRFKDVMAFWPMLLIAAGIMRIGRAKFASAVGFGIFLIIAGGILLAGNLHLVHVSWNLFWPAILILVGLQHLLSNFDPPKAERKPADSQPAAAANPAGMPPPSSPYGPETPTSGPRGSNDPGPRFAGGGMPPPQSPPPPQPPPPGPSAATVEPDVHLHEYCIFTGGKRRIQTNNFRGGEVVAVFGGVDVDLRGSQLGGDEAVIDITAAFGGCTIRVPTNWYVEMRGVAAFGGYNNKTIPPRLSPGQRLQKLVVTGSAAFGGVVIEN